MIKRRKSGHKGRGDIWSQSDVVSNTVATHVSFKEDWISIFVDHTIPSNNAAPTIDVTSKIELLLTEKYERILSLFLSIKSHILQSWSDLQLPPTQQLYSCGPWGQSCKPSSLLALLCPQEGLFVYWGKDNTKELEPQLFRCRHLPEKGNSPQHNNFLSFLLFWFNYRS